MTPCSIVFPPILWPNEFYLNRSCMSICQSFMYPFNCFICSTPNTIPIKSYTISIFLSCSFFIPTHNFVTCFLLFISFFLFLFFLRSLEEPFQNERTIPPPLVVISPHNQHHHHHPTHSLSPHSYDASRSRSSSLSSNPISANGVHHVLTAGEDSSQSSLNLSNASSGYLSGGSANSSVGGSSLNLSSSPTSSPTSSGTASAAATLGSLSSGVSPGGNGMSPVAMNVGLNGNLNGGSSNHLLMSSSSQTQISNRRRTISSNSNNG